MEIELLKAKYTFRKYARFLNASLLTYDLPVLVNKMKRSNAWVLGELDSMILLKSPKKQILLTAFHENTQIQSFQSNDSVTFQVIEGSLSFYTRKQSEILGKGELLTLSEKLHYNLTSLEDTVFLMTILKK